MRDLPAFHVASYQLWVASYDSERKLRSHRVVLCHKVEETLAYAYALIIREHNEPTDSIVYGAHFDFHDAYECYGLAFVEGNVVLGEGAELTV